MVLFERDPFQLFRTTPAFDGLFRVAGNLAQRVGVDTRRDPFAGGDFAAPANLTATEDDAHLTLMAPGFGPDDIEVSVRRATVSVRGARRNDEGDLLASFERTFRLPFPVDADAVTAKVENGVLELDLPRRADDRPRSIRIDGAKPPASPADVDLGEA